MPKKSILYIITKSVWAGAGKYVYDLATGLPKNKFEVIVAAGGRGIMAEKIIAANIPYFEIKGFQRDVNIFKDISAFFEILSLLFRTKPDIVHVSSAKAGGISGIAIFIYRLATMFRRISLYDRPQETLLRAVFTVHGWTFNESRPKWQIALIKIFSKLTCVFYDKIICVSEYDRLSAIKNNIAPERKLITIHNGIKPEEYNFLPKEETRKSFKFHPPVGGSSFKIVGTIGEAVKNKGHKYLKEAEKYFPDIKFNIISNMPDAARYLKNFDIFVLPSLKEGLPYVLLEAGLAEIPIIATNVGGIPEIIENGKTGLLIKPADPKEIADAIEKLIKDPELAKTFAQNARQKIIQDFSFEKMLDRTLAAYEEKADAGNNADS